VLEVGEKVTFTFLLAFTALLGMIPITAEASLDVSVSVGASEIMPFEEQTITVTSNEPGKGILFVAQPAEGNPWEGFLDEHPFFNLIWSVLPNSVRDKIKKAVGDKIVSFKLVSMAEQGSTIAIFASEFKGINGEPSTGMAGKYKVLLVFFSSDDASDCKLIEKDFDCASWFVVPETPFGAITALTVMTTVFAAYSVVSRKRFL